jgi:predicted O-methyltransferase YrrM
MGRLGALADGGVDRLLTVLESWAGRRHSRAPLCAVPLATASEYRRRWAEAKSVAYPVVDQYEIECTAAIDPEWFQELALLTQVPIKSSGICYQHGRLLYATLVRYMREHGREHLTIVETGTARGFSALCLAKAMHDTGASGKIITFDVLPHETKILWNCVLDASGPRTRAELLHEYADLLTRFVIFHRGDSTRQMPKMSASRINLAFLDSVHEYEHVMAEWSAIRGRQLPGDLIFFDDYTPDVYPGVVSAADDICRTGGYSTRVIETDRRRRYLIAGKQ